MTGCGLSTVVVPFAADLFEATPFTDGPPRVRLRTYYRCIIATFATLRRFNPRLTLVLATNVAPPDWMRRQLERLEARTRIVEARAIHLHPPGSTFRTSFYLFDVLRRTEVLHGQAVAFLDPDVVCTGPLQLELADGEVGFLPLPTMAEDSIKGVSLRELESAARGGSQGCPLVHVGGEILAVTRAAHAGLIASVDEVLASVKASGGGLFPTEEHVLTFVRGPHWRSLRRVVARVWTSSRYRDVPPDLLERPLWHLPAEKTHGLKQVYLATRRPGLGAMTDEALRHRLRQWCRLL